MDRRGFLRFLGLAAPAAAVAPAVAKIVQIPNEAQAGTPFPSFPDVVRAAEEMPSSAPTMRYLGLAQLKMEGSPCYFDDNEVSRFAREAFDRNIDRYRYPEDDVP